MIKLFDEDDDLPLDDEDLENVLSDGTEIETLDESKVEIVEEASKIHHDKIFDNDFNTGNLDFDEFTQLPTVNAEYARENLGECYNSYDYNRNLTLEKTIDEFFKNTEYGKLLATKKKIPKNLHAQIFVSIVEQFGNKDFTISELFIGIAEYFNVNYEIFYENIPSLYRTRLVKELDDKYGIFKRRGGMKKLF